MESRCLWVQCVRDGTVKTQGSEFAKFEPGASHDSKWPLHVQFAAQSLKFGSTTQGAMQDTGLAQESSPATSLSYYLGVSFHAEQGDVLVWQAYASSTLNPELQAQEPKALK